ncbi:MAG: histidine phosphatase family protein, partial [Armatimonadota bacterium]|nr:histidine phosphatase family protein [Armatimonadota bacterium]
MELYFFRHGDAGPAAVGTPDEARRLTERGRRETDAVAQVLHRVGLAPEVILTSPLTRARETGQILARVFGLSPQADDRLRPGCRLGAIQDLASDQRH